MQLRSDLETEAVPYKKNQSQVKALQAYAYAVNEIMGNNREKTVLLFIKEMEKKIDCRVFQEMMLPSLAGDKRAAIELEDSTRLSLRESKEEPRDFSSHAAGVITKLPSLEKVIKGKSCVPKCHVFSEKRAQRSDYCSGASVEGAISVAYFLLLPGHQRQRPADFCCSPVKFFSISMGQDVVLECQSYSGASLRPKVVTSSSPSGRNVQLKERKGGLANRHQCLDWYDGKFTEFNHRYSSSLEYKSMHSGKLSVNDDNEVLKRGSMYQSAREVRRMRKEFEGRSKLDFRHCDDAFISFEIIDHLPLHDINKPNQFCDQKFLPLVSSSAESKPISDNTVNLITTSSVEFLDLSFRDLPDKPFTMDNSCLEFALEKDSVVDDCLDIYLHVADKQIPTKVAPGSLEPGLLKDQSSDGHEKVHHRNQEEIIYDGDSVKTPPKCYSENAEISNTNSEMKNWFAEARGSKTMFSPLKRIFDPIMKSRSVRDSSLAETHKPTSVFPIDIGKKVVSDKSLLNEVSIKEDTKSDLMQGLLAAAESPAHLHGFLKLDTENGRPSFEFSLQDSEEVLSANTRKTDDACNWVYTFHSSKKKSNSSRAPKGTHGSLPSLIGQMQASCYLCSEVIENGHLPNSIVMEFVLYDIARASRDLSGEESNVMKNLVIAEAPQRNNFEKYPDSSRLALSNHNSNSSTSYPWFSNELHPEYEIAAIAIQMLLPFDRKEIPKIRKEFSSKENQKGCKRPIIDQRKDTNRNLNPCIVKVVTPCGNHGRPKADEDGPSSLLDRWRFGRGCDCGGWDMGCPIIVFDNLHGDERINHSREFKKPLLLFLQGSKEQVPALTVMADEKRQHAVHFHAHFSALQAFSICIAVLHASEVSSAVISKRSRRRLYPDSLRLLLEEEVRHLIEAVGNEEQRKGKEGVEQIPATFFLEPPISPMGRV
ncbi:hypothetical protein ZIOFF_035993 [Zingiber officinale]|uniref:Uncharacterized protein n=2 Tax=Zingiber officinale TaxID=94328 RepID=A0A8J5GFG5_ZINOF|nr:hypothetical protein ZIOFF_035993 [Zingiber officinale]